MGAEGAFVDCDYGRTSVVLGIVEELEDAHPYFDWETLVRRLVGGFVGLPSWRLCSGQVDLGECVRDGGGEFWKVGLAIERHRF